MEAKVLYVTFSIEGKKNAPDFEGGILYIPKKKADKILSLLKRGDYIKVYEDLRRFIKNRLKEMEENPILGIRIPLKNGSSDYYETRWIKRIFVQDVYEGRELSCPYFVEDLNPQTAKEEVLIPLISFSKEFGRRLKEIKEREAKKITNKTDNISKNPLEEAIMKVKLSEFKRTNYMIGDKPYFMGETAFLQSNIALANLRKKLINAKLNNEEEIEIGKPEISAVILHGITYAKKDEDNPLYRLREELVSETKELGKPALGGLPADIEKYLQEKYPEIHKWILNEEGLTTEDLFKIALENANERDFKVEVGKEPNNAVAKMKEMFMQAAINIRENPYSNSLLDFYGREIDRYIDYVKSVKGGELTKEEKREIFTNAYSGISYQIHEEAYILEQLARGKTLYEMITPENPDSEQSTRIAKNRLISVLKTMHEAFDPEFKYSRNKVKELVDRSENAIKGGRKAITELAKLEEKDLEKGYSAVLSLYEKTKVFVPAREILSRTKEQDLDKAVEKLIAEFEEKKQKAESKEREIDNSYRNLGL